MCNNQNQKLGLENDKIDTEVLISDENEEINEFNIEAVRSKGQTIRGQGSDMKSCRIENVSRIYYGSRVRTLVFI